MPRKYQPKTDPEERPSEADDAAGQVQGRLPVAARRPDRPRQGVRSNRDAIVSDVGGPDEVGHVKNALVERFVWLQAILESLEQEMAKGQVDKLGVWIQAVNSLSGLAKTLGIERKTVVKDVDTYLVERNGANGPGAAK